MGSGTGQRCGFSAAWAADGRLGELVLARIFGLVTAPKPPLGDAELVRRLAQDLLKALASCDVWRDASSQQLVAHYQLTLRELIDANLRPVTEGRDASAWLPQALERVSRPVMVHANRPLYASWVAAAVRAMGAVLRATDPGELLPTPGVEDVAASTRGGLTEVLERIERASREGRRNRFQLASADRRGGRDGTSAGAVPAQRGPRRASR